MTASASSSITARIQILVRAGLLGILGLSLTALGTVVAIILHQFTVFFVVGAIILYWSRRALLILWILLVTVGPGLSFLLRGPLGYEPASWDVLFGGYYPAITWLSYLVLGMLVGRTITAGSWRDLAGKWALMGLVTGALITGLGAYLRQVFASANPDFWSQYYVSYGGTHTDSWHWLVTANPHSGSYLEVLGNAGWDLGLLGLLLWIENKVSRSSGSLVRGLWAGARHLVAPVGKMILSAYTAHIVVIWFLMRLDTARVWAGDWSLVWLVIVPIVAACILWKLVFRRGPLEAFMSQAAKLVTTPGNTQ